MVVKMVICGSLMLLWLWFRYRSEGLFNRIKCSVVVGLQYTSWDTSEIQYRGIIGHIIRVGRDI